MTALVRAAGGRTTAPGLRSATRPGFRIGLGGRVPAGPTWDGASDLGCEGGLFTGAGRYEKWTGIKAAGLRY
jgi:hypothetical protein